MTHKNLKNFFLFTALIVLFSCGKRNDIVWVYYDETRCADRWEKSNSNEVVKANIVDYYEGQGVTIYDLEIFFDRTPDSCFDCVCKTGRRIKAKIKGKDLSDLKADGFYQ